MRVLVTGGAGFLGSHLCEALVARGDEVLCVDCFEPHYRTSLKLRNLSNVNGNPKFAFLEGDLRESPRLVQWLQDERFDAVAHLAGRDNDRDSLIDPLVHFSVNVCGTLGALEMARRLHIPRLVMTSSGSVYGLRNTPPFKEQSCTASSISPHAASKLAAENLCYSYAHAFGIRTTILRVFTAYGPRQRPDMAIRHFADEMTQGEPIAVFGDGLTGRDLTYCSDVVNGILLALDKDLEYEIINIGTGQLTTVNDIIVMLAEALQVEPEIATQPEHPADLPSSVADLTKARQLLGYEPTVGVKEGIARFVEWFRAQPAVEEEEELQAQQSAAEAMRK